MKKAMAIKQRNKVKQMSDLRYLMFAKYACIFLIVVFLIYIGVLSALLHKPFKELFTKDPIIIVGYTICTANLYIWYSLKNYIKDIHDMEHIESIRINLIILAIGQAFLLNYISALLLIMSLWKYFRWNNFSIKKTLLEIKKEKQSVVAVITLIIVFLFIALVYGIFFATRK